jgi:hypothetical protein
MLCLRVSSLVSSPVTFGLLVSSLVVSLLAGCASLPRVSSPAPENRAAAALPTWYLAPPADTAGALYGVGSASSLPGAKSAALVDVASKLMISVQSTLQDRTVLHNDQLDQHIESEIVAQVRDREFQAYDVVESALSDGLFYALVRVDRSRLIVDALDDLRAVRGDLASRLDPTATQTWTAYYMAFRAVEPSLDRAEAHVELLSTLSPEFDPAPYRAQHRGYRARLERAKARIVVALIPDDESGHILNTVQRLLSSAGMQSEVLGGEIEAAEACHDLCIEITSEWSDRYVVRRYMAALTTTFKVHDADGSVVSSRQHKARGSSLTGDKEARLAAVAKLHEALEREGVLQAVGFAPERSTGLAQAASRK